jgi:hypothetical protein
MIAVALGGADGWQQDHDLPDDVVRGIVSIGGRYGLYVANAIIDGLDPIDPPDDWRLQRTPPAVVVFGEHEADGEGRQDPERLGDCARIGRTLIAALRAAGGDDVTEVAMDPCGHWDTVRSLHHADSQTSAAVRALIGLA